MSESSNPPAPEGWTKKRLVGIPGVLYTSGAHRVLCTSFNGKKAASLTSSEVLSRDEAADIVEPLGYEVFIAGTVAAPNKTCFVLSAKEPEPAAPEEAAEV